MLDGDRVAIISGPPGVGKTTLADLLLYAHLEKGYQAVLINRDIAEGEELFQAGVRQIFYFDDFMGATFAGDRLGGPTSVNDRALLNFIAMIRASPTARLILTTREHVYAQALNRSERLRHAGLGDLRVLLNMPSYSQMQRARILYNHLYFSDLPDDYRDELLRDEFYLRIVKQEKFNPRLIEWLSSYRRLRAVPVSRYRAFVEDLMRDPSEIWRHAYEQEISDAGRSMLLALRSLGGRIAGGLLQAAFPSLHLVRATRYRFATRPEDFRLGLREIANSFIKPTGAHGFEVIDPSVLDLLNAVISAAPDNAVDIVTGATMFSQIEEIWTFAKLPENGNVLAALKQDISNLVPIIARLAIEDRRVDLGGGAVGFRAPTYERRLTTIVEMAERLTSIEVAALVAPIMARLVQAWQTDSADVNDGAELIRALQDTRFLPAQHVMIVRDGVQAALLQGTSSHGCRADELRELLSVLDTSSTSPTLAAVRSSFAIFEQRHFNQDLSDCRSSDHFDGLIEDLELFRDELGVDVERLIERVEEAKVEFEDHESQRADQMYEEYRDRQYSERDTERSVSEMFSSLRGDRD
jgi:hypothetical protein